MIKELMTVPVETIMAHETLDIAANKLWSADCGALPVVDRDGVVVGIITDRDICMSAWMRRRMLTKIRVDEAMSKHVFALRPEQDVVYAAQMMAAKQIYRIPVVDADDRLVGIISMSDLARDAARTYNTLGARSEQVVRTLAAICEPRASRCEAAS